MDKIRNTPRGRTHSRLQRKFLDSAAIDRILTAAHSEDLDSDAREAFGVAVEACVQSLADRWGSRKPQLDWKGSPVPRGSPWHGRSRNYALQMFIDSLVANYVVHLDRRPGVSVHHTTSESGGPLIAFLRACCSEVQASLTKPERLEIDPDRVMEISAALNRLTPAALQKRVQRSTLR